MVAAPNWEPVIGYWRAATHDSCGIDDIRAGSLLSISEKELRYGHILCTVSSAIQTDETLVVTADCDTGGRTPVPIDFGFSDPAGATSDLTIYGRTRAMARCEGPIE
ncbi:MAG: hypothetical protein AAF401_17835 [Pseudomonadota bacterium]